MAKKPPKSRKPANTSPKSEYIVGLLKRANGASIPELSKAIGWQEHSIRGFMSGTLKKKLKLEVINTREGDKDRRYWIKVQS